MTNKTAQTQVKIHDLISSRWSPRAFDANKSVSKEQLISLAESARWTPSCYGDQPWYYIFVDKNQNVDVWQKGFDCLVEGNQGWVKNAPVIAFVIANQTFHHNQQPNAWAEYDSGASAMALCLQAVALGLSTHQMAGFNPQKVIESFDIPAGFKPLTAIAIGYESEDKSKLPEQLAQIEVADRQRNPLGKQFFLNGWNQSII